MADDLDQRLITLLLRDARLPAAELARELGVSRSTVQNRIDKLVGEGAITGFTVRLGDAAAERLVEAVVLVKLIAGDHRPFIAELKRVAEVTSLCSASGSIDYIVEIRAATLKRLDEILMEIRRKPMVAETETALKLQHFV